MSDLTQWKWSQQYEADPLLDDILWGPNGTLEESRECKSTTLKYKIIVKPAYRKNSLFATKPATEDSRDCSWEIRTDSSGFIII